MRVMALDYGDVRTGVAVSDAGGMLVGYTAVLQGRDRAQVAEQAARLARERGVEAIVVGLPRNMDGTEGARAQLCREFAGLMEENTGLPVALWDERRTTVEAHQILHATGKRMKQHKRNVDAVAASLILEGYLARIRQGDFRNGQAGEGRI